MSTLPGVKNPNSFPFKHTGKANEYGVSQGGDYSLIQANYDSRAEYNQTQINEILNSLTSTDGATQIIASDGQTVQQHLDDTSTTVSGLSVTTAQNEFNITNLQGETIVLQSDLTDLTDAVYVNEQEITDIQTYTIPQETVLNTNVIQTILSGNTVYELGIELNNFYYTGGLVETRFITKNGMWAKLYNGITLEYAKFGDLEKYKSYKTITDGSFVILIP